MTFRRGGRVDGFGAAPRRRRRRERSETSRHRRRRDSLPKRRRCQAAGFAGFISHLHLERDGAGDAYVDYERSNLPGLKRSWDQADFSATPHGGGYRGRVDRAYLRATRDQFGAGVGDLPAFVFLGSAELDALGGPEVGAYYGDGDGLDDGTWTPSDDFVDVYVSDVQDGRAKILVANDPELCPRGAVFEITTRALDAVGNPLSRAARKDMAPEKLADLTLELALGCFVYPFPYYLGDGGASKGECSPAKMMREGARVAACIAALSKGGDWYDDPLNLTCATPNFSDGCLHFAVWVALWAAAPLLGVEAPTTHPKQLGRAAIECAVAAAASTDGPCYFCTRRGGCSHGRRSAAVALVRGTVEWRALTDDDRTRVERFFATGPTARDDGGLTAFKKLEASPAFAPLVAELKGVLERRAAPFSQNIRKAFEVLVGAARVKKSVRFSEAFIAAHETKRQEDDPMDID